MFIHLKESHQSAIMSQALSKLLGWLTPRQMFLPSVVLSICGSSWILPSLTPLPQPISYWIRLILLPKYPTPSTTTHSFSLSLPPPPPPPPLSLPHTNPLFWFAHLLPVSQEHYLNHFPWFKPHTPSSYFPQSVTSVLFKHKPHPAQNKTQTPWQFICLWSSDSFWPPGWFLAPLLHGQDLTT